MICRKTNMIDPVNSQMKNAKPKSAALIVAAGLSSRMGDFKPMLPLGESTIIRTVITKLKAVGCDPIAMVTGHRAEELTRHVSDLGVASVYNPEFAVSDMFSSVKLGLGALPTDLNHFFFLPADVPLFRRETLESLLEEMNRRCPKVIIPNHEGRRGHPILINGSIISQLMNFKGPRGMKGALDELADEIVSLAVFDPGVILDADWPEDYHLLQELIREKKPRPAIP